MIPSNELFQHPLTVDITDFKETANGFFAMEDCPTAFKAHKISDTEIYFVPSIVDITDPSQHVTRDHCKAMLGRRSINDLNTMSSNLSGCGDWELVHVACKVSDTDPADITFTGTFK